VKQGYFTVISQERDNLVKPRPALAHSRSLSGKTMNLRGEVEVRSSKLEVQSSREGPGSKEGLNLEIFLSFEL
jgi:hypothetical protein